MWLRGDGSVVQSSGRIQTWLDESGNAKHATQGTASKRPYLANAKINSLAAIAFNDGGSGSAGMEELVIGDLSDRINGEKGVTLILALSNWSLSLL